MVSWENVSSRWIIKKTYQGWKVFLRDTSLLTPTGQSLGAIGKLYSDLGLNKIDLPKEVKSNMRQLMNEDLSLFKEYAMQDSIITLWHALQVEQSNHELCNSFNIPITFSSNKLSNERVGKHRVWIS